MEGLEPLRRRVAGIDVHRMLHVVTVVVEDPDGGIEYVSREFGGFKRDLALATWSFHGNVADSCVVARPY
ncbi:hypothetical protein [Duganella sp. BuS-21]|uniref:hypothetical protein n=1 Tax=Duganella sp. BuS-21 TaxID=2943848 RepID=UPI0035A5A509